jgi:hypothetical protein
LAISTLWFEDVSGAKKSLSKPFLISVRKFKQNKRKAILDHIPNPKASQLILASS